MKLTFKNAVTIVEKYLPQKFWEVVETSNDSDCYGMDIIAEDDDNVLHLVKVCLQEEMFAEESEWDKKAERVAFEVALIGFAIKNETDFDGITYDRTEVRPVSDTRFVVKYCNDALDG